MNIPDIIKENKKRRKKLLAFYDPVRGVGSPIKRFKFKIADDNFILLPRSMKKEVIISEILKCDSVKDFCLKKLNVNTDENPKFLKQLINEIIKLRMKYDFEFWSYSSVKIIDKISKLTIPFKLRSPQRKLLAKLEKLRLSGVSIRIILLKARQWGGSTLVQIYMAWIQLFHKINWHSAILAEVDDQARNIRGMYTRLAINHPKDIQSITFAPYEGSSKNRVIIERGCIVGIGSAEKPDNLRSYDFSMIHMSELGSWKSTPSKSAEDLAQNVRSIVPDTPYSIIVMESTAKGVGNFFHREWQAAVNKDSGYLPVFIPWFEIEIYQEAINDYNLFIRQMNEYDTFLWKLGATLEGICWYNKKKRDENYDTWRMNAEFPSTEAEAFSSTGRRAFAPSYVLRARKNCIKPSFIGEIYANSRRGKEALKGIEIEENSKGGLCVWVYPDKEIKMKNRFCVFMDIGGRTDDADYTVIKVLDRYWLTEGGVPEVAAVWHGHLDQDLAAWKAAQIATYYDNALLAVEMNSLDKKEDEGDHFLTVLDEIAPFYDNLYQRTTIDQIKQGVPVKYGFHTNLSTKPMIIDGLNAALRDELYVERDNRSLDEMDWFEIKKNGKYGAVEGQHDDHVITTAGCIWLSSSYMDFPKLIDKTRKMKKKVIVSEASF